MLFLVLLSLIPEQRGNTCFNRTIMNQRAETFTLNETEVNETLEQSSGSYVLTFSNFISETDSVSVIKNRTFNITMVRYREAIPKAGAPFKLSVQDGDFKEFCYEPINGNSPKEFQSLQSEVLGKTVTSKSFNLRLSKSCSDATVTEDITGATTTTTSSPEHYFEVYVYISVTILDPLEVQLESAENAVRVSVDNIKSKDKPTSDVLKCFVNGVEITKSPHFKLSNKLKDPSARKGSSPYRKNENQMRTTQITMKCWSDVYGGGPLECSASMSGYTYWSNPLYLTRGIDLNDCGEDSRLNVTTQDGMSKIEWDCKEEHSSYTVHINRTVGHDNETESCPLRLETGDSSCSVETDQLVPGGRYHVWVVTSASNLLVVDKTPVLITETRQNAQSAHILIMQRVLVGLGVVVVGVGVVAGLLLWRSRRGRKGWSEVQSLNKENLERYETSDIVILHITNSEVM